MDPIKERRSIRKYKSRLLEKEMIDEILKAGTLAPSAKNRQPWKFIVYQGKSKDELLGEMEKGLLRERDGEAVLPGSKSGLSDAFHTLRVMREAPVLIVLLNINGASPFERIGSEERIAEICDCLSIGAAVENMLLKAAELGIGSLWIANTFFAYPELAEKIGTAHQPVGAVSLGYADEAPAARPRKSLEEAAEYR